MLARVEEAMHDPDDHLLARCKAGDLDAFGIVYERYRALLHRHACHMLGNQDDAGDALQETFLRAYRALPGFRGDAPLRTWLLTICTNLCRTRLRQRARHRASAIDCVDAVPSFVREPRGEVAPFEAMERSERVQTVRLALRGLPAGYRELIVLRDIENLSYEEIAGVLRCSRASVSVRLFRARRMLRARLEGLLEEGDSC